MRILCLSLLLVGLGGCLPAPAPIRSVEPLEPLQPLAFELIPEQTAIERFDPPGAGATVELTIAALVHNPNPFGVRLQRVSYDIAFEGRTAGRGELIPERFIAGGGRIPLRFPVTVSLEGNAALVRAATRALVGTPLGFELFGEVAFQSASHAVTTRRLPLVAGAALARQPIVPPHLSLNAPASAIFLLAADTPVVRLAIAAENPGPVGYFLYGRDLELWLDGVLVARQDLTPVPLPASRQVTFDLLFYPRPLLAEQGRAALAAALAGSPTSVELRGALKLDVLGVDTLELEGWELAGTLLRR